MSARNIERTDWKVYDSKGEFRASFKDPTDAAVLIPFYGDGAKIKYRHHTLVWHEGKEEQRAAASADHVGEICIDRVNKIRRELLEAEQRREAQRKRGTQP